MQCKHTEWWRSCRTWELESGWKKRKESLKKPWSLSSSASLKLSQSKEQSNNIHHVRLENELETYVNNLNVGTFLLAWPWPFWHVQADELNWTEMGVTFCFYVVGLCYLYVLFMLTYLKKKKIKGLMKSDRTELTPILKDKKRKKKKYKRELNYYSKFRSWGQDVTTTRSKANTLSYVDFLCLNLTALSPAFNLFQRLYFYTSTSLYSINFPFFLRLKLGKMDKDMANYGNLIEWICKWFDVMFLWVEMIGIWSANRVNWGRNLSEILMLNWVRAGALLVHHRGFSWQFW